MDIKTAADVAKKSWSLYRENAGKRKAFHIVWGFLKALEEEDIHGKSNNGS